MTSFAFKDAKHYAVSEDYDIGRQLGTGKFSVVSLVTHKQLKKDYAAKMIDRSICDNEELAKEVAIMQDIEEHPGVIHLKDVYEAPDSTKFVLILELVRGGELYDKIVEYEFYSEKDAADLIYQIVSVVKYLHNKGIVHRDLKPENLLFEDEKAKKLKLCDFGLAEKIKEGEIMYNVVGSPTYMAPEITQGNGYGKPVDMYSIGVILYILLCGYPPFEPEEGIVDLEFPSPEWDSIQDSVKKLITLLLDNDPSKRPTAEQVLQHPWISGDQASRKALVGTIRTMATYNTIRRAPGATMRHKETGTKNPVFNIFAAGGPSPRGPAELTLQVPGFEEPKKKHRNSKGTAAASATSVEKKEKRKSAQTKHKGSDASKQLPLSIGDESMRDLTKRMEELKQGNGTPTSSKTPTVANDLKDKEAAKLKEMYMSEKTRRLELEEALEASTENAKAAEDAANKASEELIEARRIQEEQERMVAEHKTTNAKLNAEIQNLQDQLKIAQREVKDSQASVERANRRAADAEKLQESTAKKLVEANAKIISAEMKIKVENIVADRLEGKRIKELEAQLEAAQQKISSLESNHKVAAE